MKKLLRRIGWALLAVFLAIQLVRPEKNSVAAPSTTNPSTDLIALHNPPTDVRKILEVACYDCHSNQTRYPWYAEIQPVGWWLASHIKDAQRELNFSTFGRLSAKRAKSRLEASIDTMADRTMPPKSFTSMHPDSRLTDEQIKAFTDWAETVIEKLEE